MSEEIKDEQEIVWVAKSPHDDITAALNSLTAIDGIDQVMLSKTDRLRVDQVRRWALRLIHHSLREIYIDTDFSQSPKVEDDEE